MVSAAAAAAAAAAAVLGLIAAGGLAVHRCCGLLLRCSRCHQTLSRATEQAQPLSSSGGRMLQHCRR
jgi:hypothetical protein